MVGSGSSKDSLDASLHAVHAAVCARDSDPLPTSPCVRCLSHAGIIPFYFAALDFPAVLKNRVGMILSLLLIKGCFMFLCRRSKMPCV